MSDDEYEDIVIKPSIELIADEYQHFKEETANIAVHGFFNNSIDDKESVRLFVDTLKENGYKIEDNNLHCLDTEDLGELLSTVSRDSEGSDGLILYFSGYCKEEGMIKVYKEEATDLWRIQDIVMRFTTYCNTSLKNTPKIFIFNIRSASLIRTDSVNRTTSYDLTYDTPAEADMLIVYKKSQTENHVDFMKKLCDYIEKYGKVEDIVSLITCLESDPSESRPLIISTLTRKFYFTRSEHRGHHFQIHQHHTDLIGYLDDIQQKLSGTRPIKAANSVRNGVGKEVKKSVSNQPSSRSKKPKNTVQSDTAFLNIANSTDSNRSSTIKTRPNALNSDIKTRNRLSAAMSDASVSKINAQRVSKSRNTVQSDMVFSNKANNTDSTRSPTIKTRPNPLNSDIKKRNRLSSALSDVSVSKINAQGGSKPPWK